jgi:hypothetical protein
VGFIESRNKIFAEKINKHEMKKLRLLLSIIAIIGTFSLFAEDVAPYQGSRIFWDLDSYKTIFSGGLYGRMIQLQDGRLMAISVWTGLGVTYSSDMGRTWTTPVNIAKWQSKYQFGVPELIQLTDGTIIVGINVDPSTPYSSERKFSIGVIRSTDDGATWSNIINMYEAQSNATEGCWEPSFLELPSGELQCYFSNENDFTTNDDQNICLCRSFDKGLTWSAPVVTSYRAGARDGMPTPILLKNKSAIVYTIEDKGWTGRPKFTATTVRTTLADNWSSGTVGGSSANRSIIFKDAQATDLVSAAPYLRQLPNGETVASYQGNENRTLATEDYYDMTVVVGDENARNFKAKSRPFSVAANQNCHINALAVIDTGVVVAIGNISKAGDTNSSHVDIIKGYPMQRALANFGTITVDGKKGSDEQWTTTGMNQIKMGNVIKNKTNIDFLYDNQNLYVTARVVDHNICDSTSFDDGIRLMIDADDVCSTSLKPGVFKINFDVNGKAKFYSANANGSWILTDNTGIQYVVTKASTYYFIEAAIPWSKLGKTAAPVAQRMAIAATIVNVFDGDWATEDMSDVNVSAPWTWLEFRLVSPSGIVTPVATKPQVKVYMDGNILRLSSNIDMKQIMLVSIDGRVLASASDCGTEYQLPVTMRGMGIAKVTLDNGIVENKKYIF